MMKTKAIVRENAKSTLKTEDALKRQGEKFFPFIFFFFAFGKTKFGSR